MSGAAMAPAGPSTAGGREYRDDRGRERYEDSRPYEDERRYGDDDRRYDDDRRSGKKRKKRSFLEDLFEFD